MKGIKIMSKPTVTFVNKPSEEGIERAWEVILRHYDINGEVTVKEIEQKEKSESEDI